MIGIICAMPDEAAAFHRLCERADDQHCNVLSAHIGAHAVAIATCGLGKVRAAMTASMLMERWHCGALVSAGTAGGLTGIEPHSVVVALELIQHDYGRSLGSGEFEIYRAGELPLPINSGKPIAFGVEPALATRYRSVARDFDYVRFGTYASGDTFVNDLDTRDRLIGLGAVAVDMESAAIAQVAEHYGVPWLVAKGISDDASTTSHDAFLEGLAEASRRSAVVVGALLPALLSDDGS